MKEKELKETIDGIDQSVAHLSSIIERDLDVITNSLLHHQHIAVLDALNAMKHQLAEAKLPFIECPFCHSVNISVDADDQFHCRNCDCIFDEEDLRREPLKNELLALITQSRATKDAPFAFVKFASSDAGYKKFYKDEDGVIFFVLEEGADPVEFNRIPTTELEELLRDIRSQYTFRVCPHCGEEVALPKELAVHECPNCGHYIVPCSVCEAKDDPEDNYCTHCCLCYQADRYNERRC